MIDPTMYIFLNQGLRMSTGKAAAQAAHAAVEAYRITPADSNVLRLWHRSGHYKKVVLTGKNTDDMNAIYNYLTDRDIGCVHIYDEGRTEIEPLSFTAIGCEIVDKCHLHYAGVFSIFELYKDAPVQKLMILPEPPSPRTRWWNRRK